MITLYKRYVDEKSQAAVSWSYMRAESTRDSEDEVGWWTSFTAKNHFQVGRGASSKRVLDWQKRSIFLFDSIIHDYTEVFWAIR